MHIVIFQGKIMNKYKILSKNIPQKKGGEREWFSCKEGGSKRINSQDKGQG